MLPTGSQMKSFQSNTFNYSTILEIIPGSIEKLHNGWYKGTSYLTEVQMSPMNKHFICLDNRYILGKPMSTKNDFNVLFFSHRDDITVPVPSFNKVIGPYCFQFVM